jgi:hypothetical protein
MLGILYGAKGALTAALSGINDAITAAEAEVAAATKGNKHGARDNRSKPDKADKTGREFNEDNLSREAMDLISEIGWLIDNTEGKNAGEKRLVDYPDLMQAYISLNAGVARRIQMIVPSGSDNYKAASFAIRCMTRLVAEHRPGFVRGLSANHNDDWTKQIAEAESKITELEEEYGISWDDDAETAGNR